MLILTSGFAVLLSAVTQPSVQDHQLYQDVDRLVTTFDDAYRECGEQPSFPARTKVETHPGLVSYQSSDQTVRVSKYDELPPEVQGMMEVWARAAGITDGRVIFSDIFNSLLVSHEMGHWMQHLSGRLMTLDRWESEVEANRIAIAYWTLQPDTEDTLPSRVERFVGFLEELPSPVPEGDDPRNYFNTNYDSLDAAQYGWFQGLFMREAWVQKNETTFCDLARLNAAAPAEAFSEEPAN